MLEPDYRLESILMDVSAGEHIDRQKLQACFAALQHQCPVEFVHNGNLYRVTPDDLVRCVHQQEQ